PAEDYLGDGSHQGGTGDDSEQQLDPPPGIRLLNQETAAVAERDTSTSTGGQNSTARKTASTRRKRG
ncbi:MAG: hypothetical protein QGH54_17370, partial [SAR202 cluster bacterium]|nr:hypothetical protein [SAR202 cluster bacterium]